MPVYEMQYAVRPGPSAAVRTIDGAVVDAKIPGIWWTEAELTNWSMSEVPPPGFAGLPEQTKKAYHRNSTQRRRKMLPAWNNLYHINSRHGEAIATMGLAEVTQVHLDAATALEAEITGGRNPYRQFIMVMPEYPGGGLIPNMGSVPDPNQPDPTYAPFTQQEKRTLRIGEWSKKCLKIAPNIQGSIDAIAYHGGGDTNWRYHALMHFGIVRVEATEQQIDRVTAEWTDETVNALSARTMAAKHRYRVHYETFLTPLQITALEDRDLLVHVDRITPPVPITSVMEKIPRNMTNVPEGTGMGGDPV